MSWGDTAAALAIAHARYWLTVAPRVRSELRHWADRAASITDPVLREQAAKKLRDERANTEVIATLYTLAPRPYRRTAVGAAVALQVMYDYLDAVTEEPVDDPLRDGDSLFSTFSVALTPTEASIDYYRFHPRREDGGYLEALVEKVRRTVVELPAVASVLPIARIAAARFAEAQVRSHAVPTLGVAQLEAWAAPEARTEDLEWWEWAGGAAASVLGLHALLSAAADARTTKRQAHEIDRAYLLSSSLTTMLDSLVDDEVDAATEAHRYIAYYPAPDVAASRIAHIARRALQAARALPNAAHHAMTVAGIAGFYLSHPIAANGRHRIITRRVVAELHPTVIPTLGTFRLWRRLKQVRQSLSSAAADDVQT